MKIYLDLLPEGKKEEIKKKKIFLKIVYQELLFSVPLIAFILILVTINLALEIRAQGIDESLNLRSSHKEYKELETYESKFSEINAKTSDIFKMQKEHLNWLKMFYKLSDKTPDDVHLSDLATTNYQISLVGKARAREDLLKFQDNLKSEDCFSNVNVPLSSLVSKEDVEFQINFEVKENCLKNSSI
jgi:Tfp pilus assembly protein PilN